MNDPYLAQSAEALLDLCRLRKLKIAAAESCTGGWIAKALTDIAGSSQWLECGFVTYSDAAKVRDLGVSVDTLARCGAVSEPVVREMAVGALRVTGSDVAVAVSGIAGPDGGTAEKPVGTVWFCVAARRGTALTHHCELKRFDGDRAAVRECAVAHALRLILQLDLSR